MVMYIKFNKWKDQVKMHGLLKKITSIKTKSNELFFLIDENEKSKLDDAEVEYELVLPSTVKKDQQAYHRGLLLYYF